MSTAVVTIISKNYLCYARTLMQSVAVAHPEWRQYVLLVDEVRGDFDPAKEAFQVVDVAQLPLPHRKQFYFRYALVELNTAVKPWMLEWVFEHEGFDRVVYLDPDTCVYSRLTDLERILDGGALMVLTPHLTGPLDDGGFPGELDILRTGSLNLGFIALSRHPSLECFLKWWQRKLEFTCMIDPDKGYFNDQRWMDFAPGMFDDVVVFRHHGYNVAHWNLYQRDVTARNGEYLVNEQPLVFWHFSSFSTRNAGGPETLSKNHDRVALTNREPIKTIARDYARRLSENGLQGCSRMSYAFDSFENGEHIPYWIRKAYRDNKDFQKSTGDDPFSTAIGYFNQPYPGSERLKEPITNGMYHYWRTRMDLKASFPNVLHNSDARHRFLAWIAGQAARETAESNDLEFPKACLAPLGPYFRKHRLLDDTTEVHPAAGKPAARPSAGALLHGDDSQFLVNAYEAILKRYPDPGGFAEFLEALRNGMSRIDVLHALRYSPEGRKIGVQIPGLLPRYIWGKVRRNAGLSKYQR